MGDEALKREAYDTIKRDTIRRGIHTAEDFDKCLGHEIIVESYYHFLCQKRTHFEFEGALVPLIMN